MKNLKTLTLILFAAFALFATSCKDTTETPTTNQTQENAFIGDWNLIALSASSYDIATNTRIDGISSMMTDTWTFTTNKITGTSGGDAFNATYSLPSAGTMRMTEDGDTYDFTIKNQTATKFELFFTEIDGEERFEVTYFFTKK